MKIRHICALAAKNEALHGFSIHIYIYMCVCTYTHISSAPLGPNPKLYLGSYAIPTHIQYTHVYMYVHMLIYIYKYIHTYIYICIHTHIDII